MPYWDKPKPCPNKVHPLEANFSTKRLFPSYSLNKTVQKPSLHRKHLNQPNSAALMP